MASMALIADARGIVDLFKRRGSVAYEGEGITQWQHAWQCGQLAREAGATPALQAAAWLHDLGHLLTDLQGTPTLRGHDDQHEQLAPRVLRPLFGPTVADPVALHVQAKRYLVSKSPGYAERLSEDSQRSLALQGGPMDEPACAAFLQTPHAQDALRLRVWDDKAKDPTLSPGAEADSELAVLLQALAGLHEARRQRA
jgi:phosphonate degradation associated HDIG domain protein